MIAPATSPPATDRSKNVSNVFFEGPRECFVVVVLVVVDVDIAKDNFKNMQFGG